MRLTVLGSGGNSPIPRPTCDCRVCGEAREKGPPYARRGNSLFVHDENVLIDTPEFVWDALNREGIGQVDTVFLSHFHADHTLGLRVVQALALEDPPVTDFVADRPRVLMSEVTHERTVGTNEGFSHLADVWADVETLADGETVTLGDLAVTHRSAPIHEGGENAISGFVFEAADAAVFVSPDENRHLDPEGLPALDLWIKETGYFSETPDGRPLVTDAAEERAIAHEMTFEESLEQVRTVAPDRTVFTEIEELYRRSYDDYCRLEREIDDLDVAFAYDGMDIEV